MFKVMFTDQPAGDAGLPPRAEFNTTTLRPSPPSEAQLVKAARELDTIDWEVRRVLSGRGIITARCLQRSEWFTVILPPDSGSSMDYARKIIAQAAIKTAETMPQSLIDLIDAGLRPELPERREYMLLEACKRHIRDEIMAIAQHGGPGRDGSHLNGVGVLLGLLGVPLSEGDYSRLARSAAPVVAAQTGSTKAHRSADCDDELPFHLLPKPSKTELKRAWKYVRSSALGLRVTVTSLHPLKLALSPCNGFEKRFSQVLSGKSPGTPTAKAVANALVLKTLIDVAANADMAGLRAWLPTTDVTLIYDNARSHEVLTAYEAKLFNEVIGVIDSTGAAGLPVFAAVAYLP